MKKSSFAFMTLLAISGCIGVDYLDDPQLQERLEVTPQQVALRVAESVQLVVRYFDETGMEVNAEINWVSSVPEVASVDEEGRIEAKKPGQSVITASYNSVVEPIEVTVVSGDDAVATVEVSATKTILAVGESTDLTATVRNIDGQPITGVEILWFSENSSIVAVDGNGRVTAQANGLAGVHAKSHNVKSNSIEFVVGDARTGDFVSAGGYHAEGMAALRRENGNLILELSEDFKTSFALGTFIYLSNSTSGSATFSNGLEIAQITTNGAKRFVLPGDVGLFDYRYVVVLCKPARVTFGYADLE